jgi:hypothetical protein
VGPSILSVPKAQRGQAFALIDKGFDGVRSISKRAVAHADDGKPRSLSGRVIPNPVFADIQSPSNVFDRQQRISYRGTRGRLSIQWVMTT